MTNDTKMIIYDYKIYEFPFGVFDLIVGVLVNSSYLWAEQVRTS